MHNDMLFWTEKDNSKIYRSYKNGTNKKAIIVNVTDPYGIDVDTQGRYVQSCLQRFIRDIDLLMISGNETLAALLPLG